MNQTTQPRAAGTAPVRSRKWPKCWRCTRPLPISIEQRCTAVAAHCGFASFAAGETIMREGDPGNFACVILEGEVDVFVELPAGRILMATLGRKHDRRAWRLYRHAAHRDRRRPHRSRRTPHRARQLDAA